MANWSDERWICQAIEAKWISGRILRDALQPDGLFPLRIKLKGPSSEEMNTSFAAMLSWIAKLRKCDRHARGHGYELEDKEVHHRLSGKNSIPAYAIIPTLDDAVQLLGKEHALQLFLRNSSVLLQEWDILTEWVLRAPFQVVTIGDNIHKIVQVLRWFERHEQRDFYLRQLDIEGVDTKFIESHKGLFSDLLSRILPPETIALDEKVFELRFGLRTKPHLVRFRILDERLAMNGCTDITVSINEFNQLANTFQRVFITENEINFLSFPNAPQSCVVFGGGYRVELLGDTPWLHHVELFYWGDIDTDGLNILSRLRAALPQTQSFLMSEDVLLSYQALWSEDDSPFKGDFTHLTEDEYALARNLQAETWGKGVRLEQERIRFSEVERFVATLR